MNDRSGPPSPTVVVLGVPGSGTSTVAAALVDRPGCAGSRDRIGEAELDSRLATLQPLQDDEPGASVSGAGAPEDVVDALLAALDSERDVPIPTKEASP